jgi:broad specificity phosphatase PhoE
MRHGRTESNRLGVYAGRSDEPLSAEGVTEVASVAPLVAELGVRRIVSSPVRRALQTAELVAARLSVPLEVDDDLAEMLLGPWTGLTEGQVAARYPAEYALWHDRPSRVMLEGRETLAQVQARGLRAAERARRGVGPVLLVTHVALVRTLLLDARGASLDEYKTIDVPNCVVFELRGTASGEVGPGVA